MNESGGLYKEIVKPISLKNIGRMSLLQKSSDNVRLKGYYDNDKGVWHVQ